MLMGKPHCQRNRGTSEERRAPVIVGRAPVAMAVVFCNNGRNQHSFVVLACSGTCSCCWRSSCWLAGCWLPGAGAAVLRSRCSTNVLFTLQLDQLDYVPGTYCSATALSHCTEPYVRTGRMYTAYVYRYRISSRSWI